MRIYLKYLLSYIFSYISGLYSLHIICDAAQLSCENSAKSETPHCRTIHMPKLWSIKCASKAHTIVYIQILSTIAYCAVVNAAQRGGGGDDNTIAGNICESILDTSFFSIYSTRPHSAHNIFMLLTIYEGVVYAFTITAQRTRKSHTNTHFIHKYSRSCTADGMRDFKWRHFVADIQTHIFSIDIFVM